MIAQGFTEFQTPILTASSPRGLAIFWFLREFTLKIYALPQAPQMFKQLLIVVVSIGTFRLLPVFETRTLGRPLSGEFYQLDFEMSFVTQEDVFAAIEPVLYGVFEEFSKANP